MKSAFSDVRSPALIGLLLVLPFMILEWVNRRGFPEGFPFVLFGLLWLLPTLFLAILMSMVRSVRAGNSILENPMGRLLRVGFLVLIAWMWASVLIDQMPCFLGVPNCD